jgi:hypothetical protein
MHAHACMQTATLSVLKYLFSRLFGVKCINAANDKNTVTTVSLYHYGRSIAENDKQS